MEPIARGPPSDNNKSAPLLVPIQENQNERKPTEIPIDANAPMKPASRPDWSSLPPEPIRIPPPPPETDPNYWGKLAGENEPINTLPDPSQELDVLVVGGGLSGLTLAFRVLEAAKLQLNEKPKVAVLDSAAKLGGRTRSASPWEPLKEVDKNAGHISYGGTWVMLDNHDLLSLSWDLDHLPFQPTLYPNFTHYAVNWQLLVMHPYLLIKLRTLGSKIWHAKPGTDEWNSYLYLDHIPLEQWMEVEARELPFPEHAKQAVRDYCFQAENFPQRPEHLWYMSTWYLARTVYIRLSHVAQTGLFFPKVMRWENGTGEVIDRLVKKIRDLDGYLCTEHRVRGFDSKDTHVEVRVEVGVSSAPVTYRAKRVVVAGSPEASIELEYKPTPLPQQYFDFAKGLRLWDDTGTQVVLAWKTRWWDEKHLSVVMLPPPDDEGMGVYGACMDLSDHGPAARETYAKLNKDPLPAGVGVLRILVKTSRLKNPDGSMWSPEKCKRSAFRYLSEFGRLKRHPEDLEDGFLMCWIWNHEWNPDTLGTAFYGLPKGLYARNVHEASKPWGRFHFAGSERSPRGVQWMEGAVYMGQLKAPEVLEALYPDRFRHDYERRGYKARIARSEAEAVNLLRSTTMHHKFRYIFEMAARWAVSAFRNVIDFFEKAVELDWLADPPPLPPGHRHELITSVGGAPAKLTDNEAIYSDEGKFRVRLVSSPCPCLVLEHLRIGHEPEAMWHSAAAHGHPLGPFELVLQPSGDLQILAINDADPVWSTNTRTAPNTFVQFRFTVNDERGMNLYGCFPDGSRQVIWSAHTWEVHFARKDLRKERHENEGKLKSFHNELNVHRRRAYRLPQSAAEQRIERELFEQQAKEKEYGRLFATVRVDRSADEEPDRLHEGGELRGAQALLSPHERHRLVLQDGELVLLHKRHGIHPVHRWEQIWEARKGQQNKPPADSVRLNAQGQLELRQGDQVVWSTTKPVKHRPPYRLHIQDDSNIVIYDSHLKPIWSSGTARECDIPESDARDTW